jgi:hypothetical protein
MYTPRERIQIIGKWLLSFTKSRWGIGDYPVRVRKNGETPEPGMAFCAQILNWPGPIGLGPTRKEAYDNLARDLEEIRKHRESMARPGSHVAIEFAPADRVNSNEGLLHDFIERVLGFRRSDPVFISDLSSLGEFGDAEKVAELVRRIKEVYGVEVADMADGNIADILERIQKKGRQPAEPNRL